MSALPPIEESPSTKKHTKPTGFMFKSMATLWIESGGKTINFPVHKELLEFYSSYFKTALNKGYSETLSSRILIQDHDEKTLTAFCTWLYTTALPLRPTTQDKEYVSLLLDLWVFGDFHQTALLQNMTIDALQAYLSWQSHAYPSDRLTYVFEKTVEQSKLRTFLIDQAVMMSCSFGVSNNFFDAWDRGAMQQLLNVVCNPMKQKESVARLKKPCAYHIHPTGIHCQEEGKQIVGTGSSTALLPDGFLDTPEGEWTIRYHSITISQPHDHLSFEELRLMECPQSW